jgi:phosphate transport system permease protein
MNNRVKLRLAKSKAFEIIIIAFAFLITLPLLAIIYFVLKTGVSKINWNFLTNIPKPVGEIGGGIANALLGSIIIVAVAAVIAVPIGILCGIFFERKQKLQAFLFQPPCR